MKKIINGRLYDTEKATPVGTDFTPAGFGVTDFQWYSEQLYRKRTGEYFLHGEGGPLSPYSEPYGQGGSQGGSRIAPLTAKQAREWAETHISADEWEAEFGTPEEGEAVVSARVSLAAKRSLEREAARTGETQARVVERLLEGLGE
jgi:hypothetical protein